MKTRIFATVLAASFVTASYAPPARAIGCISGGLAGAVAGHMVHHGVLGAVGGCIAGHSYNKRQKRQMLQQQSSGAGGYGNGPQSNYDGSTPSTYGSRNND